MFSNIFKDSPSSSRQSSSGGNKEAALEDILPTPALRVELAVLVVLCTDAIRNDLNATFKVPPALESAASFHDPKAEEDLIALDDSQKAHASRAAERAERVEKIKRELQANDVQELHRAALSFFNAWRVQVLKRVGEVLKVRSKEVALAKQERERSSRMRQDLDLLSQDDSQTPTDSSHLPAPIPTTLVRLPEQSRALILNSILLLLLSLQNYPAHSRLVLLRLSSSLRLPTTQLCEQETAVAKALLTSARQLSAEEETARAASTNATSRKWKVGLATVAGAALIGVTGGLAAPLLAAGVGTVLGGVGLGATAVGGLLGGLAGSSVLVGGLFGAYGGRITGQMMDKYAREVSDFRFVAVRGGDDGGIYERQRRAQGLSRRQTGSWKPPARSNNAVDPASEHHRLRIAIAISGWLSDSTDVFTPWFVLGPQLETFALRWEVDALLKLGTSLSAVLKSAAWGYAKYEIVKRTVLGSLAAGLWPLMLLRVARIVDNPFSIAKNRSDKAGQVLADALVNKAQGERPVTLIGYSLGARVIYSCLLQLAERRAFGLVENVVIMGAPTPSDAAAWRKMRTVVAGRVVNVYSSNDHILGFLYRTSSVQLGIAGLQEVQGVQGVENVDVSAMVDGHTRYRWLTGTILKKIGMEELDEEEVRREEEELRVEEEKERKAEKENERKVEEKIEKAGDSPEERRIVMQDVVEEEAKLLEMRTGVGPEESAKKAQSTKDVDFAPPFEKLNLAEEQAPPQPPRPSQTAGIRRKPVGEAAAAPSFEEAPPAKPPRPTQSVLGSQEDIPPPQPPRRTTPSSSFEPVSAVPMPAATEAKQQDILHDDYDDDNISLGDDDVESVHSAASVRSGEMMMLAPEAEPDSEPEQEPEQEPQPPRRKDVGSVEKGKGKEGL